MSFLAYIVKDYWRALWSGQEEIIYSENGRVLGKRNAVAKQSLPVVFLTLSKDI